MEPTIIVNKYFFCIISSIQWPQCVFFPDLFCPVWKITFSPGRKQANNIWFYPYSHKTSVHTVPQVKYKGFSKGFHAFFNSIKSKKKIAETFRRPPCSTENVFINTLFYLFPSYIDEVQKPKAHTCSSLQQLICNEREFLFLLSSSRELYHVSCWLM